MCIFNKDPGLNFRVLSLIWIFYLFPMLESCMHLCKHVCCFSPYAFPSAWLLTTGLVNELEYETGLMLYENVYDSRVCGRVSCREEWRGLKVCNQHTQAICDQVQQWPGNLHLCLQAQQASEQLVFVLLFLPYGKVLSGASIWLVVGAQLTIRSGFWNWLMVGHRPSRPSTEGISEVLHLLCSFSLQIIQVNLTQENLQPIKVGKPLELTYAVEWVETNITFARRFDAYLDYPFFEHQVNPSVSCTLIQKP